ncbi:hypothetical protein D3C76_1363820 [compost metagenome]
MQRTTGLPGSGCDAILFGFRHMFTAQFLQPSWRLGGTLKVKQARVENCRQRHLTHQHWDNPRVGVESTQNGTQLFTLVTTD